MRWIALGLGIALLAVSAGAFTLVADSKEGQIAEVITLLAFGTGFVLALYGVAARPRPTPSGTAARSAPPAVGASVRAGSPRDLAFGAGGIALTAVLVIGLALSAGPLWAGFGFVALLPMLVGSVYLCWRSLRAKP